jgi:hypothetical protein
MRISDVYDGDGIMMEDKNKVQLFLGLNGKRNTL